MSDDRTILEKTNFFDGQKITESDLDTEQIYHEKSLSYTTKDSVGSGIVNEHPFDEHILLDTRSPGLYSNNGINETFDDITSGEFDSIPIKLDAQPTDRIFGSRLAFKLFDTNTGGSYKTKILIIGRVFDGADPDGILDYEILEFSQNEELITNKYFTTVSSIIFNNFSGGTGSTINGSAVNKDNIGEAGYCIVRVAKGGEIFPATLVASQKTSPNIELSSFIFSNISDGEITDDSLGLDNSESVSDLYIDTAGLDNATFEENTTGVIFGQKFLLKSNNIQKVGLALSFDGAGTFSGTLIVSINKLTNTDNNYSSSVPNEAINFDPEFSSLAEVSYDMESLADIGYELSATPKIVYFNFSNTSVGATGELAQLEKDKYYAILVKRVGTTDTGNIKIANGNSVKYGKTQSNITLYLKEEYEKINQKFIEFDPVTGKFVNDSDKSLWFEVHSVCAEVVAGPFVSFDNTHLIAEKTESYIGNSKISKYHNYINLVSTGYNDVNYIFLNRIEKFTDQLSHPITGNPVFTRIKNTPVFTARTESEYLNYVDNQYGLYLGSLKNKNVKYSENITGAFEIAGQLSQEYLTIINPSSQLLENNYIGRIFTPDVNCSCNDKYIITKVKKEIHYAGDLDSDGVITNNDLLLMSELAGNNKVSEITQQKLLSGEIKAIDFYKADLNGDGSVDGSDITSLENAISGVIDFSIPKSFIVLKIYFEPLHEAEKFQEIFSELTAASVADTQQVTIVYDNINELLSVSTGDIVNLSDESGIEGSYVIGSVQYNYVSFTATYTLILNDENETFAEFEDTNVSITSGTIANVFANNPSLLNIPYENFEYKISLDVPIFDDSNFEKCETGIIANTTFIEKINTPDNCDINAQTCDVLKNQTVLGGDLYLPNGNIYSEPGIPIASDYEVVNIEIPLPPGTIEDCSIDLYNTFMRINDDCNTIAGYPALRYSDGTFVGADDTEGSNDIQKNRVKISASLSGLYVDSLIDGYAVDQVDSVTVEPTFSSPLYKESALFSFASFDVWAVGEGLPPTITVMNDEGDPLSLELETAAITTELSGFIESPVDANDIDNDFIFDAIMKRQTWDDESLTGGSIKSGIKVSFENTDNSYGEVFVGWKLIGGNETKYVFQSQKYNSDDELLDYSEVYSDEPLEDVGDQVHFRIKRVNDIIQCFIYNPNLNTGSEVEQFNLYKRVGTNTTVAHGTGTCLPFILISQKGSVNAGETFSTETTFVLIEDEIQSLLIDEPDSCVISYDDSTGEYKDLAFRFKLDVSRANTLLSAKLYITSAETATVSDPYQLVAVDTINQPLFYSSMNLTETQNEARIIEFTPGSVTNGGQVEIDIEQLILGYLMNVSHLPGQYKAFVLKTTESGAAWNIDSDISMEIVYEDKTTGVIFNIGLSVDPITGVMDVRSKNVLFDSVNDASRTKILVTAHLKKSKFKNQDIKLSINDIAKIGIGTCIPDVSTEEDDCYYISGTSESGLTIVGPVPCSEVP